MKDKQLLVAIFAANLRGKVPTIAQLEELTGSDLGEVKSAVASASGKRLVESVQGRLSLTAKGRRAIRVVFIGGGFEIIHQGHLYTIQRAKELGDALVVSVARDSTIRRRKKREPIAGEKERVALLSSLRQVDAAILGVEGNIYETLEKVKPDVVALGYDQYHIVSEVQKEAKKRGLKLKVVRLGSPVPDVKTSGLLSET